MSRDIKKCKFQTGYKKGYLTVLSLDDSKPVGNGKRTYYICSCICGKRVSLSNNTLSNTNKEHCGCLPNRNFVGKSFGKIKIVKFAGFDKRYKNRKPKWIGVCSGCKKEKSYLEEVLVRGDIKSCGKCKPKGKDSPRYNPNSDRFNRRDSTEYKAWCKKVFKRDKYKCIICGKRGWINAHHLNGWNWAFRQRFDVNNGVTLCAGKGSCHNDFHDKYGRGNNTKGQFIQYMRYKGKKYNG